MLAYELGKIAMHTRIFVRLTDRTQVVAGRQEPAPLPIDDVAWKHLEDQRKRRDAELRQASRKPGELQGQGHPHDGRPRASSTTSCRRRCRSTTTP